MLRPDAVTRPKDLAREVSPWLVDHPLMGTDSGIRGLLLEAPGGVAGFEEVRRVAPPLADLFKALTDVDDSHSGDGPLNPGVLEDLVYVLAVNTYPPSDPDRFQLRPHTDRRWLGERFGEALPRWTTVAFLEFPVGARGGELVVFAADAADALEDCPRDHARRTVRERDGRLTPPQPGLACVMPGVCPHAVIGHAGGAEGGERRVTLVLAAFDRAPGDPPATGLITPAPSGFGLMAR